VLVTASAANGLNSSISCSSIGSVATAQHHQQHHQQRGSTAAVFIWT